MKELLSIAESARTHAGALGVSPAIHLDDFIFQFLINNPCFENMDGAVKYYFYDGRKSAQTLAAMLTECGLEQSGPLSMLEFASGYGCITRHLRAVLPNVRSVACDIHDQAITFIRSRLGAEAMPSCTDPSRFDQSRTYDIVFALSFFSHMPRTTWGRWLAALYDRVSPGGVLIFTTQGQHSAKHFGNPKLDADGFWFLADSEQKDLDVATYGQTIADVSFVTREVRSRLGHAPDMVREGFWWGHQDCYLVRKPG